MSFISAWHIHLRDIVFAEEVDVKENRRTDEVLNSFGPRSRGSSLIQVLAPCGSSRFWCQILTNVFNCKGPKPLEG